MDMMLLGNSMQAWLSALGIALAALLAVALVERIAISRLAKLAAKTDNDLDDALIDVLRATYLWLLLLPALYLGAHSLDLPARLMSGLRAFAVIAFFVQVGVWATRALGLWIGRSRRRALAADTGAATHLSALNFVGRLVLWSVLALMVLDNLGIDITALVAGLGIGGVAVALAVQNILGDLFASLSIVIDKPFVIGDFIVVGEFAGTVEKVGLKTTRIRSLSGEQLVFSNGDLLASRVRNYKRMQERRVLFAFGVLYQTPPEQLERIPIIVREIVEAQDDARLDRAHFKGFGESAYDFEVVYWMRVPDYNAYMDTQERINLALVRAFASEGIEFAYPTRTVFLAHSEPIEPSARPS